MKKTAFSNANSIRKVHSLNPFSLFSLVHLLLRSTKHAICLISTIALRVNVSVISSAAPLTLRGFGCRFLQGHIEI